MVFLCITIFHIFFVPLSLGGQFEACKPLQYLELGARGVIECSFDEDFHGVVWYNSENFLHEESVIRLIGHQKQGYGYLSGEFDIYSDGSLIINNVTLTHEHSFAVMKFDSQDDNPVPVTIKVVVTVRPSTPFPLVDKCGNDTTSCYVCLDETNEVTCLVQRAKPAIQLSWVARTAIGDRNVLFESTSTKEDVTFTSYAVTSGPINYSFILSLLVCKAEYPPGMLLINETVIMIEKSDDFFSSLTPSKVFINLGSELELCCLNTSTSLIVWKKSQDLGKTYEVLSYASVFEENFSKIFSKEYTLKENGLLFLPNTGVKHEGYYGCISEDTLTSSVKLFHVIVYVSAVPVIEGCRMDQYCVLKRNLTEGSLACSVIGVRQRVQLEFNVISETQYSAVSFHNQHIDTVRHGDTYNTYLTSDYRVNDAQTTNLTIECKTIGTNIEALKTNATFSLFIEREQQSNGPLRINLLWTMLAILFFIAVLCMLVALILWLRKRQPSFCKGESRQETRNNSPSLEETLPMMTVSRGEDEKLTLLIEDLQGKYRRLCNNVRPVPFLPYSMYVNSVFVQSGLLYLVSKDPINQKLVWEPLTDHQTILTDDRLTSKRRIVKGEPGYGKSTFALQLAHDWMEGKGPLAEVTILILLRLRQERGLIPISEAIKLFLLSNDCQLTVEDVKDLLKKHEKSTLIILDGYDEYLRTHDDSESEIISIIKGDMLLQSKVIITTRPSCSPESISTNAAQIKMTGFDEAARDAYIEKAVVTGDTGSAVLIKTRLEENPVLHDICEVPLFFVMFAHISIKSDYFGKFNCVTSFFRYMIRCFHSHMINKYSNENLSQCKLFEEKHQTLNKVSFEGLKSNDKNITWRKEDLRTQLGHAFYDHYVRIGILVEKEVIVFDDNPKGFTTGLTRQETEVRFFHRLFCEWYAAHYLSEYASKHDLAVQSKSRPITKELTSNTSATNNSTVVNASQNDPEEHVLARLSPGDNEYVYRFACGINHFSGEKIIKYLESVPGAQKFTILCILEQYGDVQNVLESIEKLCSSDIYIDLSDSLLLQRSVINLLKIAAYNEIPITQVQLLDCYDSIHSKSRELVLTSGLCIPVLSTLEKVLIKGTTKRKEMTVDEAMDILQFASKCQKLKYLSFRGCMLPESLQTEVLPRKSYAVSWQPLDIYHESPLHLNLENGLWQCEGRGMITEEMYKEKLNDFRELAKQYMKR